MHGTAPPAYIKNRLFNRCSPCMPRVRLVAASSSGASSTLYVAACLGLAWLLVWVCLGSDAPHASQGRVRESNPCRHPADWTKGVASNVDAEVKDDRMAGKETIIPEGSWEALGTAVISTPPSFMYKNPLLLRGSCLHNSRGAAPAISAPTARGNRGATSTKTHASTVSATVAPVPRNTEESGSTPPLCANDTYDEASGQDEKNSGARTRTVDWGAKEQPLAFHFRPSAVFRARGATCAAGAGVGEVRVIGDGRRATVNARSTDETSSSSSSIKTATITKDGPSHALRAAAAIANESLAAAAIALAGVKHEGDYAADARESRNEGGRGDSFGNRTGRASDDGNDGRGNRYCTLLTGDIEGTGGSVEGNGQHPSINTLSKVFGPPLSQGAAVTLREKDADEMRDASHVSANGDGSLERVGGASNKHVAHGVAHEHNRIRASCCDGHVTPGSRRVAIREGLEGKRPASPRHRSGGPRQTTAAVPFPWKAMATNPAAWACVAGNIGESTGVDVVTSWLPTYFEDFIGVDLQDVGFAAQVRSSFVSTVYAIR